jgi:hypothetical protein
VVTAPRVWPKLDGPTYPDGMVLPEFVEVEGWGSYGLREDGLYANTDGYPDDVWRGHCLTFDALRQLGEVREVTE